MRIEPGKDLATLFSAGAIGRLSDAELLAIFARRDDGSSEAAFESLVNRHGPMVLGVCRRILGDSHAADDAFQAVFLVLARRAPSVRVDDSLGRWLYGVTVRVARRARADVRSERTRLRPLDGIDPASPTPSDRPDDLRSMIDEEIARLPAHYRSAVVLCYLEGLSQEQAARRLRCPIRTVESRLRRARERLKPAMVRRGLAPSGGAMAAALIRSDLPRSLAILAQKNIAGTVPVAVAALSGPTLRSLVMYRILRLGIILATMGATGAGLAAGWQAASPPVAEQAKPAAPNRPTASEAADGRIELHVVADATGQPIEGAEVQWSLRVDQDKSTRPKGTTDRDGKTSLEWPKGATLNWLDFTVRKPGFVPSMVRWDDRHHPPRIPSSKVQRLVAGLPIGGVVKDQAGAPIAGAKVTVTAPPDQAEPGYVFTIVAATTDAQGRWHFDDAPRDLRNVRARFETPGFLPEYRQVTRQPDAATVLRRGFAIRGRVLDERGRPVAGVIVRFGDKFHPDPKPATTGANGEFVLENCPPCASAVTVRAPGFAPDLREVHPEDQPTLEFRLGPPHTVRGRVVDRKGQPVPDATLAPDSWRNHRTLDVRFTTDQDGRFEWRDAPGDVVLYSIFKQ